MANESVLTGVSGWVSRPDIRRIGIGDVRSALSSGFADFLANPTHLFVLGLVYPIAGLIFGRIASGSNALPLVYPLVAGFALLGPIAAVGLYEMSRQRELGREKVTLRDAFDVFRSPRIGAILLIGLALTVLFLVWLFAAQAVYGAVMPPDASGTIGDFVTAVVETPAGHTLIIVGTAVGFVFALAALMIGTFSIPLLLDRQVGETAGEQAVIAVEISCRAVMANIVPLIAWGVVVTAGLVVGAGTLLVGFAVTMPVLGHATWHLYRKIVV